MKKSDLKICIKSKVIDKYKYGGTTYIRMYITIYLTNFGKPFS